MNVKLILTDDDGNVIAITHFKTDVVDANGDIMTTEALMNAVNSQKIVLSYNMITWKHGEEHGTGIGRKDTDQ